MHHPILSIFQQVFQEEVYKEAEEHFGDPAAALVSITSALTI